MRRPKMSSLDKILLATLAALLLVSPAWAEEYSHARVVRLSLVEGDVQVMSADQPGWQKAIVNMPVREGMSIATAQGRAEIEFEGGATARLADNTLLQFTEMALADGNTVTRMNLTQGTATIYTVRRRHDTLNIQAGKLALSAGDDTRFRIDVFEDGASVSVLKGNVEVTTAGGPERVNKGQTLAVRNDAPDQIALERNPASDTWDRWVENRESAIETGRNASAQYVNSPVSYGLYDLTYYGGWNNLPGYGNCWSPYGMGAGWSPYYNGTWSYLPGFGFTWISYEPWGWMPYHYGRWAFSPAFGWVWVPGHFRAFNPGAVYWVRTPGRVGWVPMGPHDQLGGTPQNLQHGVITNTTAGLVTGQPHQIGPLATGENPRFISDPRTDAELVHTGEQLRVATTATDHAASGNARAEGSVSVSPRKMSERAITTAPARTYIVVPAAPSTPTTAAAGGHSSSSSATSGSSASHSSGASSGSASGSRSGSSSSSHESHSDHHTSTPHPSSPHPPSSHPR